MPYKKTNEAIRDAHATIGGIDGTKMFVFDNAGNQITNFGGAASATVAVGSSATIFAVVNTAAAGQSSVVLDTGVSYIGLATIDIGTNNAVALRGNVTLSDSKTFIGLTTTTLGASPAFIGIATVANKDRTITGNVTLSDAKTFIGLTTTIAINAGTNKTLIHKTIALTQASIATIAVPSNTFKITRVLLNSDATVRVNLKSGATYLTGNVTVGITLNPGGGWVENGSPDSPAYIGLAGAAAIVLEKLDLTATSAKIGGKLIYFDE